MCVTWPVFREAPFTSYVVGLILSNQDRAKKNFKLVLVMLKYAAL